MKTKPNFVIAFPSSLTHETWTTGPGSAADGWARFEAAMAEHTLFVCRDTSDAVFQEIASRLQEQSPSKVYCVGKNTAEMAFCGRLRQSYTADGATADWVQIALRGKTVQENDALEKHGADDVVSNMSEAAALVQIPPVAAMLSVVVPAYNEAALLPKTVSDIHSFCGRYAPNYEILIVDDGSTDKTPAVAHALCSERVRVVTHPHNMGMGASMRDGYHAACGKYVVSLPGDRQVKAHSLIAFLPHLHERTVVISRYPVPHSGPARAVMSSVFRFLTRNVGGLTVDISGAYLFDTEFFRRVEVPWVLASNTFLYSFQLLESFKQHGARFVFVEAVPFPREVGQSREAKVGRIVKMTKEITRHRIISSLIRLVQ